MYQGSCLCGAVAYQLHGAPRRVSHCYCRMCQKQHGAAFATYLSLPATELQYTQGSSAVIRYQSSATVTRGFCGHCGSSLEWRDSLDPDGYVALTVATLDNPFDVVDIPHICTESKSSWCPC
ncbi:MAG: GFA family protein [Rheinheimera sp.]|nr:GFA family protein [Rheinheimera sp.]